MGLIYFKARRVRIWLGRDEEVLEEYRAYHASQLIERYARLYETCSPDPGGKKLQSLSQSLFKQPGSTQHPHWTALSRLLKRPWFTRVWVVQELGLSRDAVFYCEDTQFNRRELDYLERVLTYSKAGLMIRRGLNLQIIRLADDYWRSAWSNVRIELGEDPKEAETFFDILRSVRGLECTEPKDMIYAFLGHPSAFKRQLLDVDPYYWYPTNYYNQRSTLISPNYDGSYKFPELCTDLAIAAIGDSDIGLDMLSHVAHSENTIGLNTPSWIPRWDMMDAPSQFFGSQVFFDACKGLPVTTFAVNNMSRLKSTWAILHKRRNKLKLSMKATHLGKVWVALQAPTSVPPEHLANTLAQLLGDIPRRGDIAHISPPKLIAYPYDDPFLLALAITLTAGLTTGHDFDSQPADEYSSHHLTIFKAYYRQQQAIESGIQPDINDEENADYFVDEYRRSAARRRLFLTLDGRFGLGPAISKWRDEVWLPMGAKMPFVFRPTGSGTYKILGQTFLYGVMRGEALEEKSEEIFQTVTLE